MNLSSFCTKGFKCGIFFEIHFCVDQWKNWKKMIPHLHMCWIHKSEVDVAYSFRLKNAKYNAHWVHDLSLKFANHRKIGIIEDQWLIVDFINEHINTSVNKIVKNLFLQWYLVTKHRFACETFNVVDVTSFAAIMRQN